MKQAILLTDDFIKNAKLLEHLKPCGDDLILLTLKGHLIIESLLETNLCRLLEIDHLPKEKEDNYPSLDFIHKLKLVQAATVQSEPGPNSDLFKVIAKLNTIRNHLAHNLKKPEEIDVEIKSLVDCYAAKAGKKLSQKESAAEQLRECILKLFGFLYEIQWHFFNQRKLQSE